MNEIQTLFLGLLNDILRDFTIYFFKYSCAINCLLKEAKISTMIRISGCVVTFYFFTPFLPF